MTSRLLHPTGVRTTAWIVAGILFLATVTAFATGRPNLGAGCLMGLLVVASLGWQAVRTGDLMLAETFVERSRVESLRAELAKRELAVDAMADGLEVAVMICDERASLQFANRAAREAFRIQDGMGRGILEVTLSYELQGLVQTALREGGVHRAELPFRFPEDRIAQVVVWRDLLDPARCVLSLTDITNLRRLERMRTDFVANVSHELRTPLTIIRTMAETLHDDPDLDAGTTSRYLERIVSEVDRLSMISNDLLILSAAESSPIRKQDCDLAEVVRSVVTQLSFKAREKGLDLVYEGPEELVLTANSAQMTQVALNLVDNAIKYTNEGSVHVSLASDGREAVLRVRDTGVGIASEHLARIFERFYRVDRARSRASGGTGLGLSIVKHLVESHGGQVRVTSELNTGSTFEAVIPLQD
ncbi:MAG: hypothetical protein KIS66_12015 [Fimbriimonadaceae bacterium]|nr:hypothetical protein [Fimbriimonadaceae bacterium]